MTSSNYSCISEQFLTQLQLPLGYGIAAVFDIFFKAHKIFNMNFNPALSNMMNFVQTFVYELQDGQKAASYSMKEIYNQITNWTGLSYSYTILLFYYVHFFNWIARSVFWSISRNVLGTIGEFLAISLVFALLCKMYIFCRNIALKFDSPNNAC